MCNSARKSRKFTLNTHGLRLNNGHIPSLHGITKLSSAISKELCEARQIQQRLALYSHETQSNLQIQNDKICPLTSISMTNSESSKSSTTHRILLGVVFPLRANSDPRTL